jgi:hypothetical protein
MKTIDVDRTFLTHLGRQLREAVSAGATLAALGGLAGGCGADAEDVPELAGGDNGTTSTTAEGSGGTGSSTPTAPTANLQPYPLDSLGCHGPVSTSPLYGPQCCFQATCYTPEEGASCATEPMDYGGLPLQLPSGSGSCGCTVAEEGRVGMAGPYAPNPDAPAPLTPGVCCYVVGSYGCTGRPFVVGGLGRLAGVARRDDWGASTRASRRSARVGHG